MRKLRSNTTRTGLLPSQSLVFSFGLSFIAVSVPTKILCSSLRHLCTNCFELVLVIQTGSRSS